MAAEDGGRVQHGLPGRASEHEHPCGADSGKPTVVADPDEIAQIYKGGAMLAVKIADEKFSSKFPARSAEHPGLHWASEPSGAR